MVYMGTLAISYAFSATLHVLVELPFANLVAWCSDLDPNPNLTRSAQFWAQGWGSIGCYWI
jgi:hypothetical protein